MNADQRGLKHQTVTDKIIRVYYEVYNGLGFGFLESVYESAMAFMLRDAGLTVARQAPVEVQFRGRVVGEFRADLLVEALVVVELKAGRALDSSHEAQVLNYLRATSMEIGLLFNFGTKPEFKRFVFDNNRKQIRVDPCSSAADLHRLEETT